VSISDLLILFNVDSDLLNLFNVDSDLLNLFIKCLQQIGNVREEHSKGTKSTTDMEVGHVFAPVRLST